MLYAFLIFFYFIFLILQLQVVRLAKSWLFIVLILCALGEIKTILVLVFEA